MGYKGSACAPLIYDVPQVLEREMRGPTGAEDAAAAFSVPWLVQQAERSTNLKCEGSWTRYSHLSLLTAVEHTIPQAG